MSHLIEIPTRFSKKMWVFPADSKLKQFLETKVKSAFNKQVVAEMIEKPFSFLTLLILMRSLISRDEMYDKANPIVIVCDEQLQTLLNKKAFHLSILINELAALIIRATGFNLPLEAEKIKLSFPCEEKATRALRAVSSLPTWGDSDCFWNQVRKKRMMLLPRTFKGDATDRLYLLSDCLKEVIFPAVDEKYFPPCVVESRVKAFLLPLGTPNSTEVVPLHLHENLSKVFGNVQYLHKSQIPMFVDYHLTKPSRPVKGTPQQIERWLDQNIMVS